MRILYSLLSLISLFFVSPSKAEVVESHEYGFKIVQNYEINAKGKQIYNSILAPKNWWSSSHTWSKNSNNLYIEPFANGCFCEKLKNKGSVLHMNIVYIAPNKEIRMFGALGPMQFSGSTGHLILKITEKDNSSNLEISFIGGGYFSGGLNKLAPMADKMLSEQFSNLKNFIERENK